MEQLITNLKSKITGQHRATYNRNEAAVRRQLIEPILDSLGWQTDDPDLVQLNSQTDERDIPDYTLQTNGRTETYVEAKNLSENIQDHISQLARYCNNQGIEFGVLTNGSDWLLIKTFEKDTKLRDRIIWQVSLERDSLSTILSRLTAISKEQIGELPKLIAKEKLLEKFWQDFVIEKSKIINRVATEITNNFMSKYADEDYDQETINSFFTSKLWSFLSERNSENENYTDNSEHYKQLQNNRSTYNISKQKKTAKSPSERDWLDKIPELRKVSGLNSWQAICDHLRIPVEGDSARRRLRRWVETNKPHWAKIPEPQ